MNASVSDTDTDLDAGYTFQGPSITDRMMPLSSGLILEANHHSGVVLSEACVSPLHDAILFAQGTTLRNVDGVVLGNVQLIQFTDPDGDTAWACGLNWLVEGRDEGQGRTAWCKAPGDGKGSAAHFAPWTEDERAQTIT